MTQRLLAGIRVCLVGVLAASFLQAEKPSGTQVSSSSLAPPAVMDFEISIRVYNYARVPDGILKRAQREASHILRQAGVETLWVGCAVTPEELADYPECNRRWLSTDLVVAIVTREMAKRMFSQHDVFGVAASSESGFASRASIFYHRVEEFAERQHASHALLLGHSIAHEIGHLLLGANSHSGSGIMHVPWNKHQIERAHTAGLLFTKTEAHRIRANVLARMENEQGDSPVLTHGSQGWWPVWRAKGSCM